MIWGGYRILPRGEIQTCQTFDYFQANDLHQFTPSRVLSKFTFLSFFFLPSQRDIDLWLVVDFEFSKEREQQDYKFYCIIWSSDAVSFFQLQLNFPTIKGINDL